MTKISKALVVAVLTLLVLPQVAVADHSTDTVEKAKNNRIRGGIVGTAAGDYENETWGHNEGFWVGWEYLLTNRVGLGLSVSSTQLSRWHFWHDDNSHDEKLRMTPISAVAIFHMTPGRAVDFYMGPGLSWVKISEEGPWTRLDDQISPVFEIGIDVMPGKTPFGFNLDVKHIIDWGDDSIGSFNVGVGFVARF